MKLYYKACKIAATGLLLVSGLLNSSLRSDGYLNILDAVAQGTAIYVIWFMKPRKKK